jgi:hypothetical protein
MQRLAVVLTGMMMLAGPAWADPPRSDNALATLDQFMVARSAAAKCGHADAAANVAFLHQYRLAAEQGAAALKILSSDLTSAHIEKVIADHYGEIDLRVTAIVAQETCISTRIKQALQKYDNVANAAETQLIANKNN